ncbi:RNA-guided endonuclease InsQ/TnpB family protein, partial [Leptospirillum ferriphilum]
SGIIPDMKRMKAFKFRLVPTPEQETLLSRHAGCVRFVWNKALDLQTRRLDAGIPLLSYGDMAKLLTLWRSSEEYGFLALGPVHPQQQTLKNLDRALWEALDKTNPKRFPRFKRKGEGDSLRYPDPLQIKIDLATRDPQGRNLLPRIFLPKVGWVKVRVSRDIEGDLRNATVTRTAGRWAVSLQTEREIPEPEIRTRPESGWISVSRFSPRPRTVSGSTRPDLSMAMKAAKKKLVWEQRKLSRKDRKGPKSQNFRKQKIRVARAHERVANMRLDFLHKASTTVGETQAVVYVEDLKIRNMTRSARGTKESPGRNVRQKSGLNRSILSQGWGTFLSLLAYKLERRGGRLVQVDPRNTSRTCFACGHIAAENRPDQTAFRCVSCGYEDHADTNAAKNISGRGTPVAPVRRGNPASSSPYRSVGESIPVNSLGVGRKESPSFPLSRRAKREEGRKSRIYWVRTRWNRPPPSAGKTGIFHFKQTERRMRIPPRRQRRGFQCAQRMKIPYMFGSKESSSKTFGRRTEAEKAIERAWKVFNRKTL